MDPVFSTLIGVIIGALISGVSLWLQSRWKKREATLSHEEFLFQKRLEIAMSTSRICYDYFLLRRKHALERDPEYKKVLFRNLYETQQKIFALEPDLNLLFPENTVLAFRNYLSTIDELGKSDVHWTALGMRMDEKYTEFVNAVRADIGVSAVEQKLTISLPDQAKKS